MAMCNYKVPFLVVWEIDPHQSFANRQTDGQTDGWIDRQTEGQVDVRKSDIIVSLTCFAGENKICKNNSVEKRTLDPCRPMTKNG